MNWDAARWKSLFDVKSIPMVKTDRQINRIRVAPDGMTLVAAGHDALVHRWELTEDSPQPRTPFAGHHGWVTAVEWLPTGPRLVSADSWGGLCCFDAAAAETPVVWSHPAAHDGWITSLAVSADGKHLATTGLDRKVSVWTAENGTIVGEPFDLPDDGHAVVFATDGNTLFHGDLQGTIRQVETTNGKLVRTFDAAVLHKSDRLQEIGGVRLLRVTPDGKQLLAAGTRPKNGGNVQGIPNVLVFEITTGTLLQTIDLGKDGDVYVTDLVPGPAGQWLATISGNPGAGKVVAIQLDQTQPLFETTKYPNCHSLAWREAESRLFVSATNGGSNGNGRPVNAQGEYLGNHSPIYLLTPPSM